MLRNKWFALPVVLLAFAMFANAGPIITVTGALGPNYHPGDPAPLYPAFQNDVINALQNGLSSYGTYNPVSVIAPNQPVTSNFDSWQGTVSPGSGFGSPLYFVLHITSDTQFSLSQLRYSETEPDGSFSWDYSTASPSNVYAADLIGRTGATWASSTVNGSAATQLVSELIYVGEFKGWDAAPGSGQAGLDAVTSYLSTFGGQYVTGTYSLVTAGAPSITGHADVQFETGIPEPGTIALAAMGFAAMLFVRRKR